MTQKRLRLLREDRYVQIAKTERREVVIILVWNPNVYMGSIQSLERSNLCRTKHTNIYRPYLKIISTGLCNFDKQFVLWKRFSEIDLSLWSQCMSFLFNEILWSSIRLFTFYFDWHYHIVICTNAMYVKDKHAFHIAKTNLNKSHFIYACKMRCSLVLENYEYLWFYLTFCIAILDCGLKLPKLSIHTLVMLEKGLEIH